MSTHEKIGYMRRTVEQKRARMESNMANTVNHTELFLNTAGLK